MDEISRSGQITRENLNQIQRGGPAIAMKMDRLRKQARLLEQKVGKALQKGSNVQEHIIGCEYEDIRCPNGCNQRLPKHLIEQHLLQSCPRRLVECEYCKAKIPSVELEDHYEKCELFPVDCRYECGAMKIRGLLKDHYEFECPKVVVARPYSFASVNFKDTKDEVLDHLPMESRETLRNAAKCSSELGIKSTEQSRKFENETKRDGILEQMVSGQAEELQAEKRRTEEFRDGVNSLKRNLDELKRSEQLPRGNLHQLQMGSSHAPSPQYASAPSDSQNNKRIEKLENQVALQDNQIAELNLKLQLLEATSYDGNMIWKIDNFEKKRQDEISGKSPSLYSPPFYTSRFGYKMRARIYLNGEGKGKGTHISLFLVVMKGEYDALLKWPFPCKTTLKLLAQDGNAHITEEFCPDTNSSSFRRPSPEMNIASGAPFFANQQRVMNGSYNKDNCIFVQVIVDTSILENSMHFP